MPETERFHPAETTKEQVILKEGSHVLVERSPLKNPRGGVDPAYIDDGWTIERIQKFDPKTGNRIPGEGRAIVTKPDPERSGGILKKEILLDDLKLMQADTRTFEEWMDLATNLGVKSEIKTAEAETLKGQKMDARTAYKRIFASGEMKLAVSPGRKTANESMQLYFRKES